MRILNYVLVFSVLCRSVNQIDGYFCSNFSKNIRQEFYPIKHCQRSNKTVVGVYNFGTVSECATAARSHQALAFNFASTSRRSENLFEVDGAY